MKITWQDKVKLKESGLPAINSWRDVDIAEVKKVVNDNSDRVTALEEGGEGSLPIGGTTSQVLAKKSDSDYDVEWKDGGTGGGGTALETTTDTTNFDKNLSAADTNLQKVAQAFNDADLGGSIIPVEKTGNTIDFTERANYNYTTPLSSGNITIDGTGAIKDTVIAMFVNSATEPILVGSQNIMLSGRFSPNVKLIYWFLWFDGGYSLNIQRDIRAALSTPTLQANPISDTSIQLDWNTVINADYYELLSSTTNSIGTASVIYTGALLTFEHTGRTTGEVNYYWLKAIGTGYVDSAYATSSAAAETLVTLFEDDFAGTTIDLAKWAVIEVADVSITQNNGLIFTDLTTAAISPAYIRSVPLFDSSTQILVLKGDLDLVTDDERSKFFTLRGSDGSNQAIIQSVSTGNIRTTSKKDGVEETQDVSLSISNQFKIVLESGNVSFYYWNGSLWTLIRTTTLNDDTYGIQLLRSSTSTIGDVDEYGTVYLTDYNYETLNPS